MSSIPELHKKMRELVKMFGGEIVADGRLNGMLADVYGEDYGEYRNAILSAQRSGIGKKIVDGTATVQELEEYALKMGDVKTNKSGRQEYLEGVVNNILFK